jgi:hypothetical protein
MRIHPRETLVRTAKLMVSSAVLTHTAELTEAERLFVVNAVCSDWIAGVAKIAIREERHGNADTPGGLAPELPGTDREKST